MGPDGGLAEAKLFGNVGGLHSLAQEAQNLALAVAEAIDRASTGLEVLEDFVGDGTGQDGPALVQDEDGAQDLVRSARFL